MKLLSILVKLIINAFSILIKRNKNSLKYLYTHSLKYETIDFIENDYFHGYAHIDKAMRLLKKHDVPNSIIIDVGGADGTTSKIFSQNFSEKDIYVFEPIKENYNKIELIKKNYPKLILFNSALGQSEMITKINIASRITSSSLFKLNPDTSSKIFSKNLEYLKTEDISVTTLDKIIKQDQFIGILKLDVQGYELEVLRGGISTLKRIIIVVLEMNNHNFYAGAPKYYQIDEFFRKNNFSLVDIFPSTKDDDILKEWDGVYLNNKYVS